MLHSFLLGIIATVSLFVGIQANGASAANRPAWNTPVNRSALLDTCSTGFIEAYKRVVIEIKTIAVYAKAGEQPPNLAQAVIACNKLEKAFPGNVCQVGTQTASTSDLGEACTAIRELATKLGVKNSPDAPPPTVEQVNESTPVATLASSGLVVRVGNPADLQRALATPKLIFFIDGQAHDFQSAILSPSTVRCTLALPAGAATRGISAGEIVKSNLLSEQFQSDYYVTRIALAGVEWTIDCSKYSQGESVGLTFGELKRAFGTSVDFSYAP